ncbi:purine and uridine phosphorylase [Bipolaris maydis]|uniref:purine and uridine phosphorylase n=1 Tax=Cochliobolus heterostrophus TaxID=5016 RepID=UPI0024CE2ABF|nr:purine and uridine phosphorylase [Bipolaris maydis]KAJ6271588.1 purine and uridine phosphorylase [Bipolaris maydis]
MLDEEHAALEQDLHDENIYYLGSVVGHNVVIVCLPNGRIGNNSAAAVATQMKAAFKGIRFSLMVGIGGGVPSAEADIRLGDVVVSKPDKTFGGVVQYDSGKAALSGFKRTGSLNSPPQILLAALTSVQANKILGRSKMAEYTAKLAPKFQRDKAGADILFKATYDHEGGPTCDKCKKERQEVRKVRKSDDEVAIHYGTIASGNQVIKNAAERDLVSAQLGGVLCFEMEAAGLVNSFQCLVIRGISDYADSHKNDQWQACAAATAAAYGKEVLSVIPPANVARACTVEETVQDTSKRFCVTALSRKTKQIDLFLCGPDGRVHNLWWLEDSGWSNPGLLKGDFAPGAKITAVAKAAEKLDIFACDIHGKLLNKRWYVPEMISPFLQWTRWSYWETVWEGFLGGAEVAVISRGEDVLDLFSYSEDGHINTLQWIKGKGWSKDTYGRPLPRDTHGFPVGAHITVIARTSQNMDLFISDADGNVKTLGWNDGNVWTDWQLIGRQFSNKTEISAIVPNVDTIEIFARKPNGQAYTTNWTVSSGWKRVWNQIPLHADIRAESKVTVIKLSPETLHLFVHGSDGSVHTCWRSGLLAEWCTSRPVGTQKFFGSVDVTAVTRTGSRAVDLFVSNNQGSGVTLWWTRGSKSNWQEWRALQLPPVFN